MDRGAWRAVIHEVMKSRIQLKRLPFTSLYSQLGFSGGASGKEPTCNTGSAGDAGLIIGSGKIPCRKAWQPTAVFLRGESHE